MNPQVLSVLFVHLHHEYAANRSSYIGTSEAPVDVFAALALVEMADEDDGCACVLCNITALCKAATERKPENSDSGERQDNRYGITRGASYYSRGGKHNA